MKKGGSLVLKKIQDTNFSYTTSEVRKKWVKAAFPAGEFLVSAVIQEIPWNTYVYQGPLIIPRISFSDNSVSYEYQIFENVKATTELQRPYEYFGGCVFEILQSIYPSPRLRDFVDPTADIDVLLHVPTPKFTLEAAKIIGRNDAFVESHTLGDGSLNELTYHFLTWVFNQTCNRISKIPDTYWSDLFGTAEFFDLQENEEASTAKNVFQRGPVYVIFLVTDAWAKIQILVKFPGVPADHILEFVCPLRHAGRHGSMEDVILVPNRVPLLQRIELQNGKFPIESFASILKGNTEAMVARSELVTQKSESQHKYLNHMARQKYLNSLIPQILSHPSAPNPKKLALTDVEYSEFAGAIFNMLIGLFLLRQKNQITEEEVFEATGNLVEYAFTQKYDRQGFRVPFYNPGLLRTSVFNLKSHGLRITYAEMLQTVVPFFSLKQQGGTRRRYYRKKRRSMKKKFETRRQRKSSS